MSDIRMIGLSVILLLASPPARVLGCHREEPRWPIIGEEQALDLASDRMELEKILGEPDPSDPPARRFRTPSLRAMRYLAVEGRALAPELKAALWESFARALHSRYPAFTSEGPLPVGDGAFVYRGRLGNALVIDGDGAAFATDLEVVPDPHWIPPYAELTPLIGFLRARHML